MYRTYNIIFINPGPRIKIPRFKIILARQSRYTNPMIAKAYIFFHQEEVRLYLLDCYILLNNDSNLLDRCPLNTRDTIRFLWLKEVLIEWIKSNFRVVIFGKTIPI